MSIAFLAAISAAIAIAAGAFGAHGASNEEAASWLRTGGLYQLIHAIAAIVVLATSRAGAGVMLGGSVLFAATLYAMAIGAPRWLGAITPIGGAAMIVGWVITAIAYWRAGA